MDSSGHRPSPPDREMQPRASRATLVHAVMCRYGGEAEFVEVTTLNISQSGMLIRSDVLPPVGTELEFKFILETGFELLTGTGKVMRHGGGIQPSAGVAFAPLDGPRQRILARVVELNAEAEREGPIPTPPPPHGFG